MKKQFINPSMQVVGISLMRMLAASLVEIDPDATPGDQSQAESRQYYGNFESQAESRQYYGNFD